MSNLFLKKSLIVQKLRQEYRREVIKLRITRPQ